MSTNNNLSNNVQEIVSAFEDIKDAIEERGGNIMECDSVVTYGNAIRNLPEDIYSGTFIVFKASESKPDIPEGGRWTGSEFEYPYGWEPEQPQTRSMPTDSNSKIWMSYSIITKDAAEVSWSSPVKISGDRGIGSKLGVVRLDGILYWTLDGAFLYDENGNKVKAEGTDGTNAKSAFTSFVFTRHSENPGRPSGGDYQNPIPTNTDIIWYDHVPPGNEMPWMSSRIFSSDGEYPQQNEWSLPTYAADTADIDIAFSSNTEKPNTPVSHGDHSGDDNWSNSADENTIWMAISKMRNNEWSSWEINRIKGERGPMGYSTTIRGSFSDINNLEAAYNLYLAGMSETAEEYGLLMPLTIGDAYLVNGDLWVFHGTTVEQLFTTDWVNVGTIKGESGVVFELTNDQIIIPVEPDGTIDSDFSNPTTTLKLYEGSSEIKSGVTYGCSLSGVTISNGIATIPKDILTGIDNVVFTAKYKENIHSKTCHFVRSSNAYELDIDNYVLSRDINGCLTKHINIYPKKWNGSVWEHYFEGSLSLECTHVDGSTDYDTVVLNGTHATIPSDLNLDTFSNLTNISVSMEVGGTTISENIAVVADGLPGQVTKGDDGPLIYPAGIWSSDEGYVLRSDRVPYVYDQTTEQYYVLNSKHLLKYFSEGYVIVGWSFTPVSSYQNQPVWLTMESFDAIYANIGVFKEALVGSAVFYKDFMFSQDGYTKLSGTGGQSTSEYWLFNPEDPFGENNSFYPNMCFNLKTGDMWIKRNTFTVQNNAVTLGGWSVTPGALWVEGTPVSENSDERFQIVFGSNLGLYFGSTFNVLKYAGISIEGAAFFAKGYARFNNDGSGYLGGTSADKAMIAWEPNDEGTGSTKLACNNAEIKSDGSGYLGGTSSSNAAISWNQDQVKIGFGEDALIYKLNNGSISNQRNYINCKHYRPDILGSSTSINNMVGYDHDFFFKSDDSGTFTINFNLTNITSSSDMPSNGYCGTFILANASNSTRKINISCKGLGDASYKPACNTISVDSKTCQIYKLYYYGFSEWVAIKVS